MFTIIDQFQIPISIFTTIINAYCLIIVLTTKQIRSAKYYLVSLQCFIDLVFSGLLSFVYYAREIAETVNVFCNVGADTLFGSYSLVKTM